LDHRHVKQIHQLSVELCCLDGKAKEYRVMQSVFDGMSFIPFWGLEPGQRRKSGVGAALVPSKVYEDAMMVGGWRYKDNPGGQMTQTLEGVAADDQSECLLARSEARSHMAWFLEMMTSGVGLDFASVTSKITMRLCCPSASSCDMGASHYPNWKGYLLNARGGFTARSVRVAGDLSSFSSGQEGVKWFMSGRPAVLDGRWVYPPRRSGQ
jgi:hypothetical protein